MNDERVLSYRCPKSQIIVEHHVVADAHARQAYEPVVCSACGELHFVHRETGKLLGPDKD